ncbi:glycosyltransferase [Motilimonas cestriensis]|uniref:Glycosyltransferase n=1 Tax=Motilimonas cestriensis TaxID=2742685 RepID=A0ABS8W8N1_9GAMM|nr:glycosyltransferase [Motilimonas cestriensis]MCE2594722.1 glycosyltransferase [Motilimonas cestriensis]
MSENFISMDERPLISIITPTYNRDTLIGRAIESILNQTYDNFELIIIDDGSTDSTELVVNNYINDDRVNYYKQKNSGKPSLARNAALKYVTGEWVAFLDSDDTWYKDKLQKQVDVIKFAQKNEIELAIVSGDYDEIVSGVKSSNTFFQKYSVRKLLEKEILISLPNGAIYNQEGFLKQLYSRGFLSTQANLVKANYILEEEGFREDLHFFEDTDLWLKIAKKSNVGLIYSPVATYHLHGNNITSGQPKRLLTDTIKGLSDHLQLVNQSKEVCNIINERICYYKLNLFSSDNEEKITMSDFVYSRRNMKQFIKALIIKTITMGKAR